MEVLSLKSDCVLFISKEDEPIVFTNEFPNGTSVEVTVGNHSAKRAKTSKHEFKDDPYYLAVSHVLTDFTENQVEEHLRTAQIFPCTIRALDVGETNEDQLLIDFTLSHDAR